MASRRQALPVRNHPGPVRSQLRFSRPIRCRPRRHHGIVETHRASGETPTRLTPPHGAATSTNVIVAVYASEMCAQRRSEGGVSGQLRTISAAAPSRQRFYGDEHSQSHRLKQWLAAKLSYLPEFASAANSVAHRRVTPQGCTTPYRPLASL